MFQRMKSAQVFGFLFLGLLLIGFVFSFYIYFPARAATNQHALYQKKSTITLPGVSSSWGFDGGYVDSQRRILYQSDVTNKRVDVVNLSTHKLLSMLSGFTGPDPDPNSYSLNGPNHVIGLDITQIAVSNGNSVVNFYNVIDPEHPTFLDTVSTGGHDRADAMAYDQIDHLLAVVNGNDPVPFISFIDVHTKQIVRQIRFDKASGFPAIGLDDIEFDTLSGHFFLSLTGTASSPDPYGAVVEMSPHMATPQGGGVAIIRVHHIPYMCNPSGLAFAHMTTDSLDIGIACDGNPLILHIHRDQEQFSIVPNTNGGDFVASVADGHAFAFAEYGQPNGSALIITSTTGEVLQIIPTATISHTVFSDKDGNFYVPEAGRGIVIFTR